MMAEDEIIALGFARLLGIAPGLPPHLREVIVACASGHLQLAEIGKHLGIPVREVVQRLDAIVAIDTGMYRLSPN
jgi:hypothetical protein